METPWEDSPQRTQRPQRPDQSNKMEDLLLGLTSILHLDGLDFDAETFNSQILAGLSREGPEIREAALN